jgi:hypothetical protein
VIADWSPAVRSAGAAAAAALVLATAYGNSDGGSAGAVAASPMTSVTPLTGRLP